MRKIITAAEVVEELGGPTAVGRLLNITTQAAWNWKATGKLPADTFLVIRQALKQRNCTAPASLWGMKEPEIHDSETQA